MFRFHLFLKFYLVVVVSAVSVISESARAVEILAVVSPRNTADVLSGAHQFLQDNPSHQINLRTTDQLNDLSDMQRTALIESADIVFIGGVFGDSANVFKSLLSDAGGVELVSFVAVHSDRSLVNASQLDGAPMLRGANLDELMQDPPAHPGLDVEQWSMQRLDEFSAYRPWLLSKTFWSDRDTENMNGLFRHLASLAGAKIDVPAPVLLSPIRMYANDKLLDPQNLKLDEAYRWVVIIDYETGGRPGERALIDQLCAALESESSVDVKTVENTSFSQEASGAGKVKCLRVLAKWGESTVHALTLLAKHKGRLSAIVSLQNFVLGAGEGRDAVNQSLVELGVPVLKGLRLDDITADEWRVSEEGLRWDSVHYRVAMPELQGISQPIVLAAMTDADIDSKTGVKLALSQPIKAQVTLLVKRVKRWLALQTKSNAEKKIAIIYYNHPPGRHNIGADNLNVPESLFKILQHLKRQGYQTGELPKSQQELLDMLQERGVNLPEDRGALREMSNRVNTVSAEQYQEWFEQLPKIIQDEMQQGPLGYLHVMLQTAVKLENPETSVRLVRRVIEDLKHALQGAEHQSRDRVLDLLAQLEAVYQTPDAGRAGQKLTEQPNWRKADTLINAIVDSGVEGIRGWGDAPGKVMVHDKQLLIPGIEFGNVFVGPQPPRGWELNEEILHANLSFPPTHQYLAFYQWLRHDFSADALMHLGRHSTYEFLPRHRIGMGEVDYPLAVIDDLPSVYPYIVDGVGEGIQAKRRGLAVMVDHLTPPLESTKLYDRLLELRQLVESYEAAPQAAGAMRQRAIVAIKDLVDELQLSDELTKSMEGELEVRGVSAYDQVDDELLVHEVGHYLTKLQEDFMPLGLHAFGQDWSADAIKTMLISMRQDSEQGEDWESLLQVSPKAEMRALEDGLNGKYIKPGRGNDPIRTPEVLPTGRNFFALDGGLIPSRLGYEVGVELATKARAKTKAEEADAIVLWASDVVRDEGAMIAFGFDMLGVKPVWSSRGIVKRLERLDIANMSENGAPRIRRDTLYTTSGLFRDLYGAHIVWLEQAVLMALDASSEEIKSKYPALSFALNEALKPLGSLRKPDDEPLEINHVAMQWVDDTRAKLREGQSAEQAGPQATYRIFGDAPGTYGAGVNRMVERSGSWQERSEIADVYLRRMGHAYGATLHGEPQKALFKQRIAQVGNTYLGRSSNLYGLLDNNDTFDYLGGLSLAVETTKGSVPENFILSHADSTNISIESLSVALLSELRGRFLNPQWLTPLMDEGYAGARTMGSEFFEYLWGWQVTNPDVVKNWVWDEVKSVYIDDKYEIGLDQFLEENHNVHVKSNMLAVMLVAAQKGFWQADQKTLKQLASQFANLIIEHGLPGSGHTSPSNPVFDFLKEFVSDQQFAQTQQLRDAARVDTNPAEAPSTISELSEAADQQSQNDSDTQTNQRTEDQTQQGEQASSSVTEYRWLLVLLVILIIVGIARGARAPKKSHNEG